MEGRACEELYTGLVIHGQMAWVHSQSISGAWKSRKNVRVEFDINFVTLSSKQAFSIMICTIVFK